MWRHFIDCRWDSDSKWWTPVPSAIICDIKPALSVRYSWKRCLPFFSFALLCASIHIIDIGRTRNLKYPSSCGRRVPSLTPWRISYDITAEQMRPSRCLSRSHAPSLWQSLPRLNANQTSQKSTVLLPHVEQIFLNISRLVPDGRTLGVPEPWYQWYPPFYVIYPSGEISHWNRLTVRTLESYWRTYCAPCPYHHSLTNPYAPHYLH